MSILTKFLLSDFVSLDTLGFAQLADNDYCGKIESEKKIISNFFKDSPELAVPLPFVNVACFKWKNFPHDFGNYWDFIIYYDRAYINSLEKNDEENYILFWNWVDKCQSALTLNEEELLIKCQKEYEKFS